MRVLHFSDTHIGRRAGRLGREAEYDALADELCEIARSEKPDLIILTGDLYDVRRPGVEDLQRGTELLRRLSGCAPVVVAAGNHDSPLFFDWLDYMFAIGSDPAPGGVRRIRLIGTGRPAGREGVLEYPAAGGEETIRLAALPYVHPGRALAAIDDPAKETRVYSDVLAQAMSHAAAGLQVGFRPERDLRLFMAHQYVEGAAPSFSERRIDISEDYAADAATLPRVDYLALGHIHKQQQVNRRGLLGWYAGSPMQLDFGETEDRNKGALLVEASPGRPARVEPVPLTSGRRLRTVEGTLSEIQAWAAEAADCYVKALVDTEIPTSHLFERVQELLPTGATLVKVEERCKAGAVAVLERPKTTGDQPDDLELFAAYLTEADIPGTSASDAVTTLEQLLEDVRLGREERVLPEEENLRAAIDCCGAPEGEGH